MRESLRSLSVADGAPVPPELAPTALTAGMLEYGDGSTQVFRADGTTTFVEDGRDSPGEWSIDEDGRFCSFWPPRYRACYDLTWIVEGGEVVGLRFVEVGRASRFEGRYR